MEDEVLQEVVTILERATPLGVRLLDNGTKLIGHVPHVAPQAWLHVLFSALNVEEVRGLEQALSRPIPQDYKEFLLTFGNGLSIFSGSLSLDGLQIFAGRSGNNMWQTFHLDIHNVHERPRNASEEAFFIGGYEQDGSLLYIEKGLVFRCNRNSATPLSEWPNFGEMVVAEVRRLFALFDDKGRLKTQTLSPRRHKGS